MPLQLVDPTAELPKRIQWDVASETDRALAQARIDSLISLGFMVQEEAPGEILLSPPPLAPNHLLIRVLDESGDSRILWNRHKQSEVEDARKRFDDYMKKGYRAYVVRSDGTKGARVETFDALLEEIIVAPGGGKDKGLGEYRKPREAVLVPPTHPS